MSPFTHGHDIDCPECPGQGKRQIKPQLIPASLNYSGCAEDYGVCEECGKAWCITYKVHEMTRAPNWDGQSRTEQEAAEAEDQKKEKVKQDQDELDDYSRLKAKFEQGKGGE